MRKIINIYFLERNMLEIRPALIRDEVKLKYIDKQRGELFLSGKGLQKYAKLGRSKHVRGKFVPNGQSKQILAQKLVIPGRKNNNMIKDLFYVQHLQQ